MKLTELHARLNAADLVGRFIPPPRFMSASFGNYIADTGFSSQAVALEKLRKFASAPGATDTRRRWPRFPSQGLGKPLFRKHVPVIHGRYLDGGFGVGKTHLLAALWQQWDGPKAYATFTELTAFIGFSGMPGAVEAFRSFDLICIDEFELDDVANTLMVVSFLRSLLIQHDIRIAVTSNTLPDRLGEQRFSASDFRREIEAIASYFEEIAIDGNDFRTNHAVEFRSSHSPIRPDRVTNDDFESLVAHLRKVHPVQYGAFFDEVDAVTINGLTPLREQDDALLLVQFIDKLYDANIRVLINGCDVENLFPDSYRHGGYAKKYGRAESRLAAMIGEQHNSPPIES